ncbi:MAG: NADPH-dependent 7-cyano-7-deazaguanine reductase QueF [Burkholderiaceae bacterium]
MSESDRRPDAAPSAGDLVDSPLGKSSPYVDRYDASLLFPIARAPQRRGLGIDGAPPFFGADQWTAYDFGWLNARGRPQVMLLECVVPAESPNIVESKSFKLYLNSFNGTRFAGADEVRATLQRDLAAACGSTIGVVLRPLADLDGVRLLAIGGNGAISLDRLDIECEVYEPAPELLKVDDELIAPHEETLTSDLLKTNCPVTGQPDWGSVAIHYYGRPIDHERLLQYLVSFRNHNEFHEHCVERIHMDIMARCKPTRLSVHARYTRRGGLDINPFRTNYPCALPRSVRTPRQ